VRVLFLDIDGVLNSHRSVVALNGYPHSVTDAHLPKFDMIAVSLVRGLCEAAGIQIVLSSSWRNDPDWHEIGPALGLPIIDRTPSLLGPRGKEIAAWLENRPEVLHYAIVDDDSDMLPEQRPFFVKTQHEDGLTWGPFARLCEIFSVNPFDCGQARCRTAAPHALEWDEAPLADSGSKSGSNER
jgi:hypothetical protein